ncbi:MAG: hypothetical protein AAGI07_08930 [Bacteroidota bacterium]
MEILNGLWAINGELTNLGSSAEGLLLNVRMVNVTFEDLLVTDFDPEVNTESFLAKIADYKKLGINAFTLNLQGGSPGYEGAINSAYSPDGKLKTKYLHRVADVIRICDVQGIVIILGCLYQRQDQVLRDNTAVFQAIKNTASWIKKQQFGNVILEIANEFPHQGFDHEVIRNEDTLVELIQLAKSTHPDLLVSVSGLGNGSLSPKIIEASDFILIHFNNISVQKYEDRINQLMYFHKPIVCNEDDKIGEEGVKALTVAVKNKCSWGYMNKEVNQYIPLEFKGIADDSLVYSKILELVQPQ